MNVESSNLHPPPNQSFEVLPRHIAYFSVALSTFSGLENRKWS